MPMDLTQVEQMVSWLDEERRKDKEEMGRLRQRLEEQLEESSQWIRKVQELEDRLAKAQTQLARMTQLEQALDNLRKEVTVLVEKADERWAAAFRDSERARLLEREAQGRVITEVRKELEVLPKIAENLTAREAEEQRLNRALLEMRAKLMEMREDFDEKVHGIPVLEEQRAHDVKRIAQLEGSTTELLRRVEKQASKAELLEDALRKSEQQVAALHAGREDLKAQQLTFMEEQQLLAQQRKRQMDEWGEQIARFEKAIADFAAAAKVHKDFYDKNRYALEGLEKLQTHLSQRQAELTEMQRLSDERQKRQLQEFREENEKRWKREALEHEHAWGEQQRKNEAVAKRLERLDAEAGAAAADLSRLWDELSKTVTSQLGILHQRQKELDEIAAGRKKPERARATSATPKE